LLAMRMGLRVGHVVAATNINDVVPEYLRSSKYNPRPSVATLSNAMDVGAPSNFARMLELYGSEWQAMVSQISGYAFDDSRTRETIRVVYEKYGYVIDPHGAVGYLAAEAWLEEHPDDTVVILETAHPAKFPETISEELGSDVVDNPQRLACLADKPKVLIPIAASPEALIRWLGKL